MNQYQFWKDLRNAGAHLLSLVNYDRENVSRESKSTLLPLSFSHKSYARYSVFHRFRLLKFAHGGLILSSSQFSLLTQPPLKTIIAIKGVKVDSKEIFSLPRSKSFKRTA